MSRDDRRHRAPAGVSSRRRQRDADRYGEARMPDSGARIRRRHHRRWAGGDRGCVSCGRGGPSIDRGRRGFGSRGTDLASQRARTAWRRRRGGALARAARGSRAVVQRSTSVFDIRRRQRADFSSAESMTDARSKSRAARSSSRPERASASFRSLVGRCRMSLASAARRRCSRPARHSSGSAL